MECQEKSVERATRQSGMAVLFGGATAIMTCLVRGGLHNGPLACIGFPSIPDEWCVCERVSNLCQTLPLVWRMLVYRKTGKWKFLWILWRALDYLMQLCMIPIHPQESWVMRWCRAPCSLALPDGPEVVCTLPIIVFNTSPHISNIIQLILSNFLGGTHIIINLYPFPFPIFGSLSIVIFSYLLVK